MKAFYTLAAIATFAFASAQKTVEIREFKTLAVSGKITLTFVKASKSSLEITRGEASNLKIASDGENMALALDRGNEAVEATVYYTDAMQSMAVSGGAKVYSKDAISAPKFTIAIAGGATAGLKVEVEKLEAAVASGSEMTVTGKADKIEAAVASGAMLDAKKVDATDVEIAVASGAKSSINATGTVDVNVATGGEITIYGKPEHVNEVKAADGIIKRA